MKVRIFICVLLFVVLMPISAKAEVDEEVVEILNETVKEINKGCPELVAEDMYMTGCIYDGKNLIINFLMTDDIDFSEWAEYNRHI